MQVARSQFLLPELGSRFRIRSVEHPGSGHLENHAIGINRGAGFCRVRQAPRLGGFGQDGHGIFRRTGRQGTFRETDAFEPSRHGGVDILLVVGGDELAIHQNTGGIDAALGGEETPEGFASEGIHGDKMSATGGGIEDRDAAAHFNDPGREGAVLGLDAGSGSPDQIAGLLLIRVEAVAGRAVATPVGGDAAHDYEVTHDHRSAGPAVREAETTHFLHQAALPEGLAIAVHRHQFTGGGHEVNQAGFHVHRGTADGVAAVGIVAQEVGEPFFPEEFTGFFIKTGQPFSLLRSLPFVAVKENPPIGDHGSATSGDIERPVRGVREDVFGIFLSAAAILGGATPGVPILCLRRQRRQDEHGSDKTGETGSAEIHGKSVDSLRKATGGAFRSNHQATMVSRLQRRTNHAFQ